MKQYFGILTLDSKMTESIYVKKTGTANYDWNGTDVGSIDNISNKVSSTVPLKLYYCITGFYFTIEKYNTFYHCVEILKDIFEIPSNMYNLCTYKNKKYFISKCDADNQRPYRLVFSKNISDTERIVSIFHWIIGVKGKYWLYEDEYKKITFSRFPYHLTSSNDLYSSQQRIMLPNKEIKIKMANIFISDKKLDLLKDFMSRDLRWWYLKIKKNLDILSCDN